jgi:uncharacterized protein YyaL (SSP411 family)
MAVFSGLKLLIKAAFLRLFLAFGLFFALFNPAQAQNDLSNNPSPYLAMHASDPVNWHSWNSDVLRQAQKGNKLILISSGYFACHWCHVMQQENYQNPEIANYLNQHYLSVKIDRELSPALDDYLIRFAERATGKAGWPQHVILTPKGYPVIAFTYQPPKTFLSTLKKVARYWQTQPQKMQQLAEAFVPPVKMPQPAPLTLSAEKFLSLLYAQLDLAKDDLSGGLGSSKFPNAPLLYTLLHQNRLPEEINQWLELTLEQMTRQHLYDHVNGGFFRYTVDPEWQIPHFEKMLYTQAQMIEVLTLAAKKYQQPHYFELALQTAFYAKRHLFNPRTGLYMSSESAIDKENKEGGNYLFSREALQKRLSPTEYQAVKSAWKLNQPAPFEEGWLPKPEGLSPSLWKAIRPKLATPAKEIPHDTKSLLGWNALMLSALNKLAQATANNAVQKQAKQLEATLLKWMAHAKPPRALSESNEPMGAATLEEYAYLVRALPIAHPQRQTLQAQAEKRFLTPTGWLHAGGPLLPGQQGQWVMEDGALPSPTIPLQCRHPEQLAQAQTELKEMPVNTPTAYFALRCIEIGSDANSKLKMGR